MRQINLHMTSEFEKNLSKLMRYKNVKNKSEVIRIAVRESLERLEAARLPIDFSALVGLGKKEPENKKRIFKTHNDLWK